MIAVIYARVSTKPQTASLQRQISLIRDICSDYLNSETTIELTDIGSGSDITKLSGLQSIKKIKPNLVFARDVSRLGRNQYQVMSFINDIHKNGTVVRTLLDDSGTDKRRTTFKRATGQYRQGFRSGFPRESVLKHSSTRLFRYISCSTLVKIVILQT